MHDDLKELVASLTDHKVEFIVVGSTVLAFYGRPRYTEDIDLWVRPTPSNVTRLIDSLIDFGLPVQREAFADFFSKPDQMIVLGSSPQAVDILNRVTGLDWESSWGNSVNADWEGVTVRFLSLPDFVRAKRAAGRPKDLLDLELLRECRGELPDVPD
jgi:hypothetical protein